MSFEITKIINSGDGQNKVEIYKRSEGTFGFEVYAFGKEEDCWFSTGRYSYGIFSSEKDAEVEVRTRIEWAKL